MEDENLYQDRMAKAKNEEEREEAEMRRHFIGPLAPKTAMLFFVEEHFPAILNMPMTTDQAKDTGLPAHLQHLMSDPWEHINEELKKVLTDAVKAYGVLTPKERQHWEKKAKDDQERYSKEKAECGFDY